MKFWMFCAGLGSVLGGLVLVFGFATAKSAPQEAAAAALAVAMAVVPYVLARSIQLTGQAERQAAQHSDLLRAIDKLQRTQQATMVMLGKGAPVREEQSGTDRV